MRESFKDRNIHRRLQERQTQRPRRGVPSRGRPLIFAPFKLRVLCRPTSN
jgi:hypothetical protein